MSDHGVKHSQLKGKVSSKVTKKSSMRSLQTRHKTLVQERIGSSFDNQAVEVDELKKFRSQVPKQVKTGFSPDQVNLSDVSDLDQESNTISVSRKGLQRLRRSFDS